MKRRGSWLRLGLAVLVTAGSAWCAARAQNLLGPVAAPGLPPVPPQGAWGEVIMADAQWIVVQNSAGQQFPIRYDRINQFLVRWPTDASNLTINSLVEAMGPSPGNNALQTDHVDVYEGPDQVLVTPTYRTLLSNNSVMTPLDPVWNRVVNAYDYRAQAYLYGWIYPVGLANMSVGGRLHAVGNPISLVPTLQLGVPGNNVITVAPGATGMIQMTQVTLGSWSFVEKGDPVFLLTSGVTPDSLALQRLVLYKKIPRNRWGR